MRPSPVTVLKCCLSYMWCELNMSMNLWHGGNSMGFYIGHIFPIILFEGIKDWKDDRMGAKGYSL